MLEQIDNVFPEDQKGTVYRYLLDTIEKISNHLLRNKESLKEKVGEIMGGKLLYLPTDAILDQGRKEGHKEGREEGLKEGLKEDRIEVIFENLELFGTIPNELVNQIRAIQDFSVLKKLSLLAGRAVSMEDFLQKFDDLMLQNK